MRLKKREIILGGVLLLVGIMATHLYDQSKIQNKNQSKQSSSSPTVNVKSRPVGFYLSQDFIQIDQDQILINPCDGECTHPRPSMVIDSLVYPELFKVYDEFTRIEAEPIHDISGKDFIFFTLNVPDHGGFAALYGVIVDPEAKSVVYTTPKELKLPLASYQVLPSAGVILFDLNPYFFNNSCTSCRLRILETVRYDSKQKKYVSENVGSIPGFKQILKQYEEASNDCFYQGQKRTVQEVVSLGGKDARCSDEIIPSDPKPDSSSITVGEFLEIKDKIQRIVNGEELSLVHY